MITEPQSLPIPIRRFKHYILHKTSVFKANPCDLQKRYYKHIHNLILEPKGKSSLKKMYMPKALHTLNVTSWRSGENLPLVEKLVKPYRKYLREIQGAATNHPKIQKLLPLLANLRVPITQEALKILAFHTNAKKLYFNLFSDQSIKISGEELLLKYKAALSRNLAKTKNLTAISITIATRELQAINLLFEIIEKNAPLDSLKEFSLNCMEDLAPSDFQKLRISKVLARLTNLYSNNPAWSSFLISS